DLKNITKFIARGQYIFKSVSKSRGVVPFMKGLKMDRWPENVGIIAMEVVFPKLYIEQSELEVHDKVSAGKYTAGLGQSRMGVCSDREDINSLCLTAVSKLVERNNIDYANIGRLEVGTETILDKSKSVKTVLMQLFEESGNTDVEGIDTTNACYGGTAALFNTLAWIESSAWDGRYAVVVAADIAIYAKGSARPTGGAGAVAMLVGPNAPLVIDRGVRASYMKHAYDFYKPDPTSEYPTVDGKLSIQCYLSALDKCYQQICSKTEKLVSEGKEKIKVDLSYFDAFLFHTPYCKLVQKSVARLLLNDVIRDPGKFSHLQQFRNVRLEETYFDRDIEKVFMDKSQQIFEEKTKPSLLLANQIGNMYTASLYGGLASLFISKDAEDLAGKRIALFSYGSGLASSMYSLQISADTNPHSPLSQLIKNLSQTEIVLNQRFKLSPQEFEKMMDVREQNHHKAPYLPQDSTDLLFSGTWYLESVDSFHRRTYRRV
ncbi:hypothetical protein L9F63_024036, partial [Diploptera punctata]